MRILFYDSIKNKQLGVEYSHVFEVLSELSKAGHSIFYTNGDYFAQNHIEGISFHSSANQQRALWVRIKNFLVTSPWKGEITILWSFLMDIKFFFSALKSSLLRKPDLVYRRHTLFSSDYFLARLLRVPSIKEVNGIIADEAKLAHTGDKFSLRVMNRIEQCNLPKANRIIVVTSKLKEVLHNDYKIPEDKIVVIPNGANIDLFKPMAAIKAREKLGLNQNNNYICFVGSFRQWQGVEYLVQSAPFILKEIPNTKFLIIGDGMMKEELINLAEETGVSDKFIFTGVVPYKEVPKYINASDVCAVPKTPLKSGYSPLKLYEYMACGKPVVASNLPGFEILEQNNAGILVEPENPEELAKAIVRLLTNEELREQMGENGRRYVVENQSWEIMAKKVAEVCESAVSEYKNKRKL